MLNMNFLSLVEKKKLMETKYLIIGAGLSGLSAAYHFKKNGCSDWLILERSKEIGGLCRSVKHDGGFIFDHSIHILYSSDPYASDLIKTLLDGNIIVQERQSWVYSNGVYTPYPWQANTYGLPVEIVKECVMGIIKAAYERDMRPESTNFEEWCYNTFGEGIAKYFMIPYNLKLWAIDPKHMTDAWIKDRVLTPSLDEVLEGALHRQKKYFGPNAVFWYPEKGGIEALPKGFLAYLNKEKICFHTEVVKIFRKEKRLVSLDGREWSYDTLVSTLPLPILVKAMEPPLPPSFMEAAGRLEHNTVYAINFAIKREGISPYHWVYFPEEKYLFHRISFPKNFSQAMAPDGWSTITVEVSSSKYRQIPTRKNLIDKVVADLKNTGVLREHDTPEVKSILLINPAYIIYNHTHRKDVDSLCQFLMENGIYSCGRFGEWEYLNMDHSILSGKKAAEVSSIEFIPETIKSV